MRKLIFKTLLLSIIFCSCRNIKEDKENLLKWISKTANFQFPNTYQCLNVFTGNEWGKIVKLEYDSTTINGILEQNSFIEVEFSKSKVLMLKDIDQELYNSYNTTNNKFYQFTNCNQDYEWVALIHKETGVLFFEIIQADLGGDRNKCKSTVGAP